MASDALEHARRGHDLARGDVDAHFIADLGHDPATLLVLGDMRRDLEDVVEAAPNAVGLFAVREGEDLHEEEEGGVVLLDAGQRRCFGQLFCKDMGGIAFTHADEYHAHGLSAGDVSIWIPRSIISVPESMMICLRRSAVLQSCCLVSQGTSHELHTRYLVCDTVMVASL